MQPLPSALAALPRWVHATPARIGRRVPAGHRIGRNASFIRGDCPASLDVLRFRASGQSFRLDAHHRQREQPTTVSDRLIRVRVAAAYFSNFSMASIELRDSGVTLLSKYCMTVPSACQVLFEVPLVLFVWRASSLNTHFASGP